MYSITRIYNVGLVGIKPTMFKGVYLGLPLKIKVAQKNQVCEAMSLKRYELTKEQWERIKPLSPPEETGSGVVPGRIIGLCSTECSGSFGAVRSGVNC